jgi:hypothetical protein
VQTIIDDFEDEALSTTAPSMGAPGVQWAAWTSEGGGVYKSPVDGVGRFFKVVLTRVTQQKLSMEIRDQNLVSICTRRINCPSTNGWTVRIFTGPFHALIDVFMGSAAAEALYGGILDQSPDPQGAHQHYVYGGGSRDAADTKSNNCWDQVAMVDDTTAVLSTGRGGLYRHWQSGAAVGRKTLSGARVYRPVEMWCKQTGAGGMYGYVHFAGKRHQALLCPASLAFGALVYVPIDTGVLGEFRVIGGVIGDNGASAFMTCMRSA